jgi:hypothetical protein
VIESFNWSLVHSFLLVARHGSLRTAARASGKSQPTLSRHMRQSEIRFKVSNRRVRQRWSHAGTAPRDSDRVARTFGASEASRRIGERTARLTEVDACTGPQR